MRELNFIELVSRWKSVYGGSFRFVFHWKEFGSLRWITFSAHQVNLANKLMKMKIPPPRVSWFCHHYLFGEVRFVEIYDARRGQITRGLFSFKNHFEPRWNWFPITNVFRVNERKSTYFCGHKNICKVNKSPSSWVFSPVLIVKEH